MGEYTSYDNRPWKERDEHQSEQREYVKTETADLRLRSLAPVLLAALEEIVKVGAHLSPKEKAAAKGAMLEKIQQIAREALAKAKP